MTLLSVAKETNTWLSMNTLIKRGQYSAVWSNTHLELNRLIILYHCWSFSFKVAHNEKAKIEFRRDDNQTDSNLATTVTPDENVAQHDTVIITLSIGKIIISAYNFFR